MASSPAPTTPDNAPRRTLLNRSVTAPIRTSPATVKPPPEIGATEGVETLFVHPNASIVTFTAKTSRPSISSPGREQSGAQELLSWTTTTERTLAAGELSVYRVPGSASFLNSGSLLHVILPRSQCWCVDGVSKFILRGRMDNFYRIELPGETEEDKEEVEKFKATLQKVCFYERTPCPFERSFNVEIEDEPDLEVRKTRRKSHEPAKKWKLDRQNSWKPEGWQPEERRESGDEGLGLGSSAGSDGESGESSGVDCGPDERSEVGAEKGREEKVTTPSRVKMAKNLLEQRSASAPVVQMAVKTPPPSRLRTRVDVDGTVEVAAPTTEGASERESAGMRTFQAIPTDMPPSPPDSSAGMEQTELRRQSSAEEDAEQSAEEPEPTVLEPNQAEEDRRGADVLSGAEGEDETVIVHNSDGAEDEVVPDDPSSPIEEQSQDAPAPLDAPSPDLRPGDAPESAPTGENSEPERRPSTPPPRESWTDRRPRDPFTLESQPKAASNASSSPTTSPSKSLNNPEDPFAAIQARILARRSIGGTTSFHSPPTRQSTSSSSSAAASVSSTLSRRSHTQAQQAFATAMVKKACSVFLGPPAHLVAIMLRIAARFATGAFGVDGLLYVESPRSLRGRVPGSYQIFEGEGFEDEVVDEEEWEEDDFGVPLRSPVRLASASSLRRGSAEGLGLKERGGRGWDVE